MNSMIRYINFYIRSQYMINFTQYFHFKFTSKALLKFITQVLIRASNYSATREYLYLVTPQHMYQSFYTYRGQLLSVQNVNRLPMCC